MEVNASVLIVVLHYTGMDDTVECLSSLASQTHLTIHTLVIVNGSPDFDESAAKSAHPLAEILHMPTNLGWSGGNNVGIRLGLDRDFDAICLLNNDTMLPPDTISLLAQSAAHLAPCVLHPAIDSYDSKDGIQLDPIARVPATAVTTPISGHPGVYEIDLLNGSCVLISTQIFRSLGLIDERFFLLYEDADLGLRVRTSGYKIYCDTRARILHKESRAFGGRRQPIKTYYGMRNGLLFAEKHRRHMPTGTEALRRLGWTIWHTAQAADCAPASWFQLFLWCLSRDVFAHAIRLGIRDYLLRRFGRIRQQDAFALNRSVQLQ